MYSLRRGFSCACMQDDYNLSHACLTCAQSIDDISWSRTMELCCSHLDLVEVHRLAATPHTSDSAHSLQLPFVMHHAPHLTRPRRLTRCLG